ncbi:DUF1289 domain-containing protein [Pseudoalteromonas ostreae]|uniref:DUF1289 domain-containing protein n=1 Tax=Pseudoalteromonas ostreae TaxID=2774154 RepID=UPI001B35CB33|nr:DUF1289 domain-containing protein [Pseudoalteromonas ostreae]
MNSTPQKSSLPLKTDCIGKCHRLKGYCGGCGRTSDEIFDWIILSDQEKQAILGTPREDANNP